MEEVVIPGFTGVHFIPGDAEDLATKVRGLVENEALADELGQGARREFEAKYTEERNHKILIDIYEAAARRRARESGR
jgi:glycosyltransferase involved in cell wall biosynthesis